MAGRIGPNIVTASIMQEIERGDSEYVPPPSATASLVNVFLFSQYGSEEHESNTSQLASWGIYGKFWLTETNHVPIQWDGNQIKDMGDHFFEMSQKL